MQSVAVSDARIYFIAHNNNDVYHYSEAEQGQEVTTGQPVLEVFTDRNLFINRLIEFNRPLWYISYFNSAVVSYGLLEDKPENETTDLVNIFYSEGDYNFELLNNNIGS